MPGPTGRAVKGRYLESALSELDDVSLINIFLKIPFHLR